MRALAFALVVGSTAYASSIDHELFVREIRRQLAPVKLCYESALAKDPKLLGRVALQVELVAGRVRTVIVRQSTLPMTSPVPGCIAKAASKWRLPPDPRPVVFEYPFVLTTEDAAVDGRPSVRSGLSVEQVVRVLDRHAGAARVCSGAPEAVEVVVTPEGKAEVASEGGTACLRGAIRSWAFPASSEPTRFVHVFP